MPIAEPVPPPPGKPTDPVPPPPGKPDAQAVPPTRAMAAAQPTFQPAQDDRTRQDSPRQDWSQQPVQDSPQPGWPEAGGTPGSEGAGEYGVAPPPGKRRRRGGGRGAYPGYPGGPAPKRRRRGRRWTMAIFALIVVVVLLVIADRVALAVAENDFADQAVSNGMPVKPSVTIEGFPFLTQVIARDFHKVDISATNIPAGPVNITSVKATLTGMHLNSSFSGATVDHISATGFVSFGALASVGSVAGLTMTDAGANKVKITAGIGPLSDTEFAKIVQTGPTTISVQVLPSNGVLSGVLQSFGSFSFSIPKLPVQVHIQNLSVTPQGLVVTATADHAVLSKT
jgi:multisubunit Na+/H+ antiporter MnhB subunit